VAVWFDASSIENRKHLGDELAVASGPFWAGQLWVADGAAPADTQVYETAWTESEEVTPKIRRSIRRRTRGFWLDAPSEPAWPLDSNSDNPPVIAFYSFKGGVGRTTALASFAVLRARLGERVAVLDLDLDAPGVGLLLSPNDLAEPARWGVVDYLMEAPLAGQVELRDYYHVCAREAVTGPGEIFVFPAGRLNRNYLGALARLDLEPPRSNAKHPILRLLEQAREELHPDWILLDCRAGLSEASGFALSGLAHLTVLFGTTSEQSWIGLGLVVDRLGAERIRRSKAQLECLVVQAMVPEDLERGQIAKQGFAERCATEFENRYFAEDPSDPEEDNYWYVRDMDDDDAPHVPVALSYRAGLAGLQSIEQAIPIFLESEFGALENRISSRFEKEST